MRRLTRDHVCTQRCLALGASMLLALGSLSGVAVACEGGGEEAPVEVNEIEKGGEGVEAKFEIHNPNNFFTKVTELKALAGKGAINDFEGCSGKLLKKNGEAGDKCFFKQALPTGFAVKLAKE